MTTPTDGERLVSPNGFDGHGPVPEKVTDAAKRIAHLRVKFVSQWTPGMENPLTTREVDQLFDAAAICAEWSRELYEAVHDPDGTVARLTRERDEICNDYNRAAARLAQRDLDVERLTRERGELVHHLAVADTEIERLRLLIHRQTHIVPEPMCDYCAAEALAQKDTP